MPWGRRVAAAAVAAALAAGAMAPAAAAGEGASRAGLVSGWREFRRTWTPPPAFGTWDGLGPLYDAESCAECHFGPALAGRLLIGEGGVVARGLALRLGDAEGRPDPLYGRQLQTRAVGAVTAEGRVVLAPTAGPVGFGWTAEALRGPLAPATSVALRLAPAIVGRAALARIDEEAVAALAAAQAARGDGIAGRPRWLAGADGTRRLGRFGARADQPDLAHQSAWAFALDMGVASPIVPAAAGDCTPAEADCLAAPDGRDANRGGVEVAATEVAHIVLWLSTLEAPAQRRAPPPGAGLFAAAGCAACHVPTMPATGGGEVTVYSDLLLHDMGPGLDDGVGAPGVGSRAWRTTPLLALAPHPGRRYLHDGRAATLAAAIGAHGGEAAAAARAFAALPGPDRETLLAFLAGL